MDNRFHPFDRSGEENFWLPLVDLSQVECEDSENKMALRKKKTPHTHTRTLILMTCMFSCIATFLNPASLVSCAVQSKVFILLIISSSAQSFQEIAGFLQEVEDDRMMLVSYQLPPRSLCILFDTSLFSPKHT